MSFVRSMCQKILLFWTWCLNGRSASGPVWCRAAMSQTWLKNHINLWAFWRCEAETKVSAGSLAWIWLFSVCAWPFLYVHISFFQDIGLIGLGPHFPLIIPCQKPCVQTVTLWRQHSAQKESGIEFQAGNFSPWNFVLLCWKSHFK